MTFTEFVKYVRENAWTETVMVHPEDFVIIQERASPSLHGRFTKDGVDCPCVYLFFGVHRIAVVSASPEPPPAKGTTDLSKGGRLFV